MPVLGFSLGGTVESETKGIWIWVVPHPNRDDCCLVLIDTEGLGDMDKVLVPDNNSSNVIRFVAEQIISLYKYIHVYMIIYICMSSVTLSMTLELFLTKTLTCPPP